MYLNYLPSLFLDLFSLDYLEAAIAIFSATTRTTSFYQTYLSNRPAPTSKQNISQLPAVSTSFIAIADISIEDDN
jgi:hypothetical protein